MGVLTVALLAAAIAAAPEPFAENGDALMSDKAPVRYVMPDLDAGWRPSLALADDLFTITTGMRVVMDVTSFSQDAASLRQVGQQDDVFELRSARLQIYGKIGRGYQLRYRVAAEYKGFATDPDRNWQLTDLSLTFPINGNRNSLSLGKIREPFSYEMENSVPSLPQAERVLTPFFVSRNVGVRMTHVLGAARQATLSYGVYNRDWEFAASGAGGTDFAVRATGLVWDRPETRRYLHLGAAWRHVGSAGQLRYDGRPESNVTDTYVDTGDFAASGADHFGVEALLNIGSVSVLGELVQARVDAPALGNPRFGGFYVLGSWFLTGEMRPYDRNVGYARRVVPTGRWGAVELVARLSHVDLDDAAVAGGRFDRLHLGINWWASAQWKLGLGWGRTWLDRFGEQGVTDAVLTRLQWVY